MWEMKADCCLIIRWVFLVLVWSVGGSVSYAQGESSTGDQPNVSLGNWIAGVPSDLQEWVDWVEWDKPRGWQPVDYRDKGKRVSVWPAEMTLSVRKDGGEFRLLVEVFKDSWLPLPGDAESWPLAVKRNSQRCAVVSRKGRPVVELPAGSWEVTGLFQWEVMPQTLQIPREVGVLRLSLLGQAVPFPKWGSNGQLWLKRSSREATDKDYLSAKVYRNLADGAPLWLETEIELTVTGKSREETLGHVLPAGWQVGVMTAPIPCAIDETGLLKAQVRAGKWSVQIRAFRTTPPETIEYATGTTPIVAEEFISLQNQPSFRLIEFTEVQAIDAAQTTFPDRWKDYPLYLWDNTRPVRIIEKLRGMGVRKAPGLSVERSFWLDEDGSQMTFQDSVQGAGLRTWRLDAAQGQELGAVKVGGESQLITYNPTTEAMGIEVRVRNLALEAVGRMARMPEISATGWQQGADSLRGRLYLPPGWRALAVLGPDETSGDWMSAWSLLDVFFWLVFTVAIFKLYGWRLGLLAAVAFGLGYQEPGVPRGAWVALLLGLAFLRVVPDGRGHTLLKAGTYGVALLLVIGLIPFSVRQVQQALYPQLENHSVVGTRSWDRETITSYSAPASMVAEVPDFGSSNDFGLGFGSNDPFASSPAKRGKKGFEKMNLKYDSKAKIQTGPAVPEWSWREVGFEWSGPVSKTETLSFVLIPRWAQAGITVLRVVLLGLLFWSLLRRVKDRAGWGLQWHKRKVKAGDKSLPEATGGAASLVVTMLSLIGALAVLAPQQAEAQFPSTALMKQLGERLEALDAGADTLDSLAYIPQVDLTLTGRNLRMEVEIHATRRTAVPLPGRVPGYSPISVMAEDGSALPTLRRDGFLWVVAEEGTQRITVDAMVPSGEWTWQFLLAPQYVQIDAPGWTVTGVKPNGVPEKQVFLAEQNRSADQEAAYDRKDFAPIFRVSRELELGLVWQARTVVRRLVPSNKAVSLSLPLLPGERVLTPGLTTDDGRIELRLSAGQSELSWDSELAPAPEVLLMAEQNEQWVEQWRVLASSVWNVELGGLAPIYEAQDQEMTPVWYPWPGEQARLQLSRPTAIDGDTLTIRQAIHEIQLGARQRTSSLKLAVQTSLGRDFILGLAPEAEVTRLLLNGKETPVRREGQDIIIPLHPGEHNLRLSWKTPGEVALVAHGDAVQLPVDCANTSTMIRYGSQKHWVLWTAGPQRGPAVMAWPVIIVILILGAALGRLPHSPLRSYQWILLLLGLSQLPAVAWAGVVAWFFWTAGKRSTMIQSLPKALYNLNQLAILGGACIVVGLLLVVLYQGLLGTPEMRIQGESSYAGYLEWFQARGSDLALPQPSVVLVSIWFYRGLMLLWSVWLAFSLLRWSRFTWDALGTGGYIQLPKKPTE